jgi:hypothetical protein
MFSRISCGAIILGAALSGTALSGVASAQTSRDGAPQMWQQMAQRDRAEASSSTVPSVVENGSIITMIGCLEREADYRTRTDAGKGGKVGTGAGLGNEYVLVTGPGGCSSGTGEAYELTGSQEKELDPFVGLTIEITGRLKDAKIDAATGRPTGGFDPLGQDLRLREVEVAAFREPVSTVARLEEPRELPRSEAPVAREQSRVDEDPSIGTAGQESLPRTASPLAAAGLLGLLAVGGAAGLRALRVLPGKRLVRR